MKANEFQRNKENGFTYENRIVIKIQNLMNMNTNHFIPPQTDSNYHKLTIRIYLFSFYDRPP